MITVWILGDQLINNHPALSLAEEQAGKDQVVILLIESEARARRLPYQRKKLVLLFSAMRHFAEKLLNAGYQLDYRRAPNTSGALIDHVEEYRPEEIFSMAASEFRGRKYQETLAQLLKTPVTILTNTQFLTGRFNPFPDPQNSKRYIQEQFYRKMRKNFGLLIEENGEPMGGKWNFDESNRFALPMDEQPPAPISFTPDKITIAVIDQVNLKYQGSGQVEGFDLAVTHAEAELAAKDFFDQRMVEFGRYEDAMSSTSDTVYHSRLSAYLNLGLLDPLELAREAQKRYQDGQAPINSVEGFIRQLVGWREYIYWQYWRLMPEILEGNFWQANRPLPKFFWNGDTRLNCLRIVINRALRSGYTHHIERLMIVANFCLLTGINPRAVNDWFLSVYIDAYEWVMVPNVFGMGLYAEGGTIATKPYISTANYINKMSDYCQNCLYDRKLRTGDHACPFNYLYWNFIFQHEEKLRGNPRMGRSLLGLRHLDQEQRKLVKQSARAFLDRLDS